MIAIDKLNLTTFYEPDKSFLEDHGEIIEANRGKVYKYMCRLDNGLFVLFYPHKFSETRNALIPFTKFDFNPKYFTSFDHVFAELRKALGKDDISPEFFNVSRIDLASDMEDVSMYMALLNIHVKKIQNKTFNIINGSIYGGSNPKVVVYDKVAEIAYRKQEGIAVTDYEEEIVKSEKDVTRFEIRIKGIGLNLQEVLNDPESLVSYFDKKIELFDFGNQESSTPLQFWRKLISKPKLKELDKFRRLDLMERMKSNYILGVRDWFSNHDPF